MKNEIRNTIELWIYIIHKNDNKIQMIENLSSVSTKSTLGQGFIAGKTTVIKWVHIKTEGEFPAVEFEDGVFSAGEIVSSWRLDNLVS